MEYALEIEDLSKSFKQASYRKGGYSSLKSGFLSLFKGGKKNPLLTHSIISNLNLKIPKGDSVGLIGRNGSGKSTLLKLLTGIYQPDQGRITVKGRVAALIELGAGFHPDFTGRENIILGGVMYGLSRQEIESLLPEIIAFSELENFIDAPVRTYSSGMFMRLGFSLAMHSDPDVLLVDEVLSVGDAGFVSKCKDRLTSFRKLGKTLILVSHDLDAVERWCNDALWLSNGEVVERGEPRRVIDCYRKFIEEGEEARLKHAEIQPQKLKVKVEPQPLRWGSKEVEIERVKLLNDNDQEHQLFQALSQLKIEIYFKVNAAVKLPVFGIAINDSAKNTFFGTNTHIERYDIGEMTPSLSLRKISCKIDPLTLSDGVYSLDVAVHREDGYAYDYHKEITKFTIRSNKNTVGLLSLVNKWSIE
jgi:ABC-2 type transport system ATP-binding protein/lipopolysaccharide transport system ATP-binding protein